MPYIKSELRNYLLNTSIQDLLKEPKVFQAGELNFLISTLIWSLFESNPCYQRANEILGVLSAVTLEFYRRKVADYEDRKILENGDLEQII
jgi:hypothetical protein